MGGRKAAKVCVETDVSSAPSAEWYLKTIRKYTSPEQRKKFFEVVAARLREHREKAREANDKALMATIDHVLSLIGKGPSEKP